MLEQFEDHVNITFNARGKDGLAYFTGTVHGWSSWTNTANGETLTQVYNFVDKDQKVVDNGDGTLTIPVLSAGGERSTDQMEGCSSRIRARPGSRC